jgi:hypothetical protein
LKHAWHQKSEDGNVLVTDKDCYRLQHRLQALEQGSGSLRRCEMFLENQFPFNSNLKVKRQAIAGISHRNMHGIKRVKMEMFWLPIKIVQTM